MKKPTGDRKVILFDIDGTLISPLAAGIAVNRYSYAVKKALQIDLVADVSMWKRFNGWSDRGIFWTLLSEQTDISKELFLERLPLIEDALVEYSDLVAKDQRLFERIEDACQLFDMIHAHPTYLLGTLTGNLGKSAQWKLRHTGISPDRMKVGVYGHEADTRDELAALILPRIEAALGGPVDPTNVVFIGDTIHDIRCAKTVGASSIAVTTGWNVPVDDLEREKPDLLVNSLMDPSVLSFLGLS